MFIDRRVFSVVIIALLFSSMVATACRVQPVEANYTWTQTIYINADGSVSPASAPISLVSHLTYALTDNIVDAAPSISAVAICVLRDNIILDGAGFTLQGTLDPLGWHGVKLDGRSNVTIRNMKIKYFNKGIYAYGGSVNTVLGNNITNNDDGVYLYYSSNNTVSGNNITYSKYSGIQSAYWSFSNVYSGNNITNNKYGVSLDQSPNCTVSGNNITNNNQYGVFSGSSDTTVSDNNIANNWYGVSLYRSAINNTVSGNRITLNNDGVYVDESSNHTVSGNNITNNDWGVWLRRSNHTIVSGNNITDNSDGVYLYESSNNTLSGNNITNFDYGVRLSWSSNNTICENNVAYNAFYGVWVYSTSICNTFSGNNMTNNWVAGCFQVSFNSTISGNNVSDNDYGVWLESSNYTIVSGNDIANNLYHGVLLYDSINNTVTGNNVTNNGYGVRLSWSSNNTASENNITNNGCGAYVHCSSDNKFYHNNLIDNTQNAYFSEADYANAWDNGYPSGGNYWDDYYGDDEYSGPDQDQFGSDGIGDEPYVIDANNQDEYPLVNPYAAGRLTVRTSVQIGGITYQITIESNTAIRFVFADPATLHFSTFGSPGTIGQVKATLPVEIVKMPIQILIDDYELEHPPWPEITTNGTHYFVYFEFVQSDHNMTIQYAVVDLAITNISLSKNIVGQGFSLTANVTVQNQGNRTETFNATLYANDTIIATILNTTLASGDFANLTFTWNTSGFPNSNYTMNAYVWLSSGETDAADNTFAAGTIRISIPGDIEPCDGYVGIDDIFALASHFGQEPIHPEWNGVYDINNDNYVGIDDIFIAASHFGEEESSYQAFDCDVNGCHFHNS